MSTQRVMYMVGYNVTGQCGFNVGDLDEGLTRFPHKDIDRIFCGHAQIIFANNDLSKIWAAGFNSHGECGVNNKDNTRIREVTPIKYFENSKIKISHIFNHICGFYVLFLSNDQKLYGCGDNSEHQMGWNDELINQII